MYPAFHKTSVSINVGSFIPNWHPQEPQRQDEPVDEVVQRVLDEMTNDEVEAVSEAVKESFPPVIPEVPLIPHTPFVPELPHKDQTALQHSSNSLLPNNAQKLDIPDPLISLPSAHHLEAVHPDHHVVIDMAQVQAGYLDAVQPMAATEADRVEALLSEPAVDAVLFNTIPPIEQPYSRRFQGQQIELLQDEDDTEDDDTEEEDRPKKRKRFVKQFEGVLPPLIAPMAPLDTTPKSLFKKLKLESDDTYSLHLYPGVKFNDRGWAICGATTSKQTPCQRIGKCQFHNTDHNDINMKLHASTENSQVTFKKGWSIEEHSRFLKGLEIYGKGKWKAISKIIRTRTPAQVQSHASKYFLRAKITKKTKKSINDNNPPPQNARTHLGPVDIAPIAELAGTLALPNLPQPPDNLDNTVVVETVFEMPPAAPVETVEAIEPPAPVIEPPVALQVSSADTETVTPLHPHGHADVEQVVVPEAVVDGEIATQED